jgi:hypothetical protein
MGTVPSTCTVCAHVDIDQIDAELRSGGTHRKVAAAHPPLHARSVGRHERNGHVAPDPNAPGRPGAPQDPERFDPIAALRRVAAELEATDTSRLAPAAKIQHLDALRRVSADIARTIPPAPPDEVTIEQVEGMEAFLSVLIEVLEPHVQIRDRLRERLEQEGLMHVFG